MPTFKGVPVEVEIAMNEKVFSSVELVQKKCRGEI
jgi:formylmethanofuran dehydrogenase subunit D